MPTYEDNSGKSTDLAQQEESKPNAKNPDDETNAEPLIHDDNDEAANNDALQHSGRLHRRLRNFDVRTHRMNSSSYIRFADVRKKGSFLKQSLDTENAKEWAETHMTREKGRPTGKRRTTWTNLHPSSVVFLHWAGFDPLSSLPPPDEEITQALGFLAHDFLGKIVEKVRERE